VQNAKEQVVIDSKRYRNTLGRGKSFIDEKPIYFLENRGMIVIDDRICEENP